MRKHYLALLALSIGHPPAFAIQHMEARFTLRTDAVAKQVNETVTIDWGLGPSSLTTDHNGETVALHLPAYVPIDLRLEQPVTQRGSMVGQAWELSFAPEPGYDQTHHVYEMYQPEARAVQFRASDPVTYDPYSDHWVSLSAGLASYDFPAEAASLTGSREVEAYAEYVGLDLDADYDQGFLLRLENPVSLDPSQGILIGMKLTRFHGGLALDGFEIVNQTPITAGFLYSYVGLEDGHAWVFLQGDLPAGDNLILIRRALGTPSDVRFAVQHVQIPSPPADPQSSQDSSCPPCTPTSSEDCEAPHGPQLNVPPVGAGAEVCDDASDHIFESTESKYIACAQPGQAEDVTFIVFHRGQTTLNYYVQDGVVFNGSFARHFKFLDKHIEPCTCDGYFRCTWTITQWWQCTEITISPSYFIDNTFISGDFVHYVRYRVTGYGDDRIYDADMPCVMDCPACNE